MPPELREVLVAYFSERGKLVQSDALELLLSDLQPLVVGQHVLETLGPGEPFVTRAAVAMALSMREAARAPPLAPRRPAGDGAPGPDAAATLAPFTLLLEGFQPPLPGQDPLQAYRALFSDRFHALSRLLKGRSGLPNVRPIGGLRPTEDRTSVIGMVREARTTSKKHHVILTLEDESGSASFFLPKEAPFARVPFLCDEVVGAQLQFPRDAQQLPRVTAIERPDIPAQRALGRSLAPSRALFLSDLHIGSKSFLSDSWGRLADFLHGGGPRPELAGAIRFVVISGDLVDGIGVYPHQERDLAIPDVFEQYAELGRRLGDLPSRLTIIVLPGMHDAVSPAEPQPALSAGLAAHLPPNVRSVANPATFSLDGVVVGAYHGRSLDDLIPALPGTSYSRPTEAMKRMLQMRHLAPIYGGRTPLAPLPRDGLVIDPVPDILVTGHAHTYSADRYRNVLLLNVSTWQGETEYQRMRNIVPVPGRAALVDLTDLSLLTLDASGPGLVFEGPAG